ncbi:E3 ubiquitin-protein ligase ATL42 [Linum perenne]
MFFLTFLILCYSRFCHTSNSQPVNPQNLISRPSTRPTSRFSGIDKELIDSLPFFKFSHLRGSKQGLECAVCISRFEDSDTLRLLPSCKHAFHMECIDQWLKSHSSCPLCRYKYDPSDPDNFVYSQSLRYLKSPSNVTREVFVQREQDGEDEDRLLVLGEGDHEQLLMFHKLKHRVIVSEVAVKNRWSEVNSSDMLSLNSEMLRVVSRSRFCSSTRIDVEQVKEDMEKKRGFESKMRCGVETSDSCEIGIFVSTSGIGNCSSDVEKVRSMSEIVSLSRFKEMVRGERDERTTRVWLPIARRTVEWFAGQQGEFRRSQDERPTLDL